MLSIVFFCQYVKSYLSIGNGVKRVSNLSPGNDVLTVVFQYWYNRCMENLNDEFDPSEPVSDEGFSAPVEATDPVEPE